MTNIKNFNFNKLDLKLSNSDYWDFFLASDEYGTGYVSGDTISGCSVVWYDFNNVDIYPQSGITSIFSLVTWDSAFNDGCELNTIGLTGIDNGLITFYHDTGDTTNQNLLLALTGSTLIIPSGDTRMFMNQVTGTTGEIIYPIEKVIDPTNTFGDYIQLCGGFYQGFYKIDGRSYEVLPNRVNKGWAAELWLKPNSECGGYSGLTLNDLYPDNKGLFFYMGTRAENKFWNRFNGLDSGCTSGCTVVSGCTDDLSPWCTVPKETNISIIGDYGFAIPLSPPQIKIELVKNEFLIYGRAYDSSMHLFTGETGTILTSGNTQATNSQIFNDLTSHDGLGTKRVYSYDGSGLPVARVVEGLTNTQNPFLIYGRSTNGYSGCTCGCCGSGDNLGNQTVCSFSGMTTPITSVDYNLDIIDNALGFRITDDGRIGYRMLVMSGECQTNEFGAKIYSSGVTVEEGYSEPNMVKFDEWNYIVVRFSTNYLDDCKLMNSKARTGKLMFYVNAKLKYTVNDFPEFMGKRLEENSLKQVGVPFNFSLGGGSQGLLESQTFDGLDMADRNLPIETNFGGTFIGAISQFKFNICDLNLNDITNSYLSDVIRYGIQDTDLLLLENGFLVLQENGYGIDL